MAYEMRSRDWGSDVCSAALELIEGLDPCQHGRRQVEEKAGIAGTAFQLAHQLYRAQQHQRIEFGAQAGGIQLPDAFGGLIFAAGSLARPSQQLAKAHAPLLPAAHRLPVQPLIGRASRRETRWQISMG